MALKRVYRAASRIPILLVGFSALLLLTPHCASEKKPEVHMLAGAGLMKPLEELAGAFERNNDAKIVAHYGGAGELMGQLSMGVDCDLFIPGAAKYVNDADQKGWIESDTIREVVLHVPVIAVALGNPKRVNGIPDLARPEMSVALGDPNACAIGNVADSILSKSELTKAVNSNIRIRTPTVNQLLLYIALEKMDATIIWKDMAFWAEAENRISVVEISEEHNVIKTISIGVSKKSENRRLANEFCEFVDSEEGHRIWSKWGFSPCAE